jgi:SAM-dependent methyltransferase
VAACVMSEAITGMKLSAVLGVEESEARLSIPDDGNDLSYYSLNEAEKDRVVLQVLQTLESPTLQRVGDHRQAIWELAWKAQAERFAKKHFSRTGLVPDFMSATPVMRFEQRYIRPQSPHFEYRFFDRFRTWLFQTHCSDAAVVYEFGCGSGFNLVALADINPNVRLVGLDWADHSIGLIREIASVHRLNLESRKFDFFQPDDRFSLSADGVVLTVSALEQVGERFTPFVDYLLKQKPKRCIHIEPIYEFYDPTNLLDYLAIKYHEKRNYLRGFWPFLRELESQGRIVIQKARRLYFGSLFHEAYNYVIWEPR